jgi:polar amino acid transport system substrate-binding protein
MVMEARRMGRNSTLTLLRFGHNRRVRGGVLLLIAAVIWGTNLNPAQGADLAPTGTLRAAFLGTNPVQARTDPKTGEITGPIADLVRELARRLNVPFKLIPAPNAQGVIAHVQDGSADIGFLAYEAARSREVEFAGPFAVMYNTHLVRADSPLHTVEDADRDGVTIGAVRAQTQELYLSANLKHARVKIVEAQPSQADLERMLGNREVDAFAQNTQRAADAVAEAGSRVPLRALTGSYVGVEQSFVVKKGDTANAAMLDKFVDELRASGFIRASLDRAQLATVGVAPARRK